MNLTPTAKPFVLTQRDEEILRVVYQYRYMTSLDVAHLLFRPTYLSYVRGRLSRLAGGKDLQPHAYLCRFKLPTPEGNGERVFTLGVKGREFLSRELGLAVDWYFRPGKPRFFSYSNILHHLLLTRFVAACECWCRGQNDFAMLETRLSYDLARQPAKVTLANKNRKTTVTVIPDAWVKFDHMEHGAHKQYMAVLFELDRGMEYQQKFKQHIKGRIAFIRSGQYQQMFGVPGVIIAYATTGQTPQYRLTRCKTMNAWTRDVLAELDLQHWSGIFRFTALEFKTLYEDAATLFTKPVWYRPDSPATPVALLIE